MFIGLLFVMLLIFSSVMTCYHKWLTTRDAFDIPAFWAKDSALLSFEIVRITIKYVSLVAIAYNYGWLYGTGGYAVIWIVGQLSYEYHFKKKVLALTEDWLNIVMRENPLIDHFQAHMDVHITASNYVSGIKFPGDIPAGVSQELIDKRKS